MLGRTSSESSRALSRALSTIGGCFVAAACSAGGGATSFSDGTGATSGVGAGGGGVIFVGGTGANGTAGAGVQMRIGDTDCVANVRQGEHVPLDLYIMFDQSASMVCPTASGASRWDALKSALVSFVQDPGADGIGVGIQYFGLGPIPVLSSCNVTDYLNADVEIAPLPQNAQPIVNSLNGHGPATTTSTAVALQGAVQHAQTWKTQNPGHTVVVILVTDGQPNACGAVSDVVAAASGGFVNGIPTYVVGVVSGGVDCGLDPNPPNQPDLDAVANAGGTGQALIVDGSGNAEQQFLAKMNEIRGSAQVPCAFQIPPPPPGDQFDRNLVNIEFTDANGQQTVVYAVPDASGCNPATGGGWYFDNPTDPKTLLLCPTTCNTVTTTVGITVKVALGCQSIKPPA